MEDALVADRAEAAGDVTVAASVLRSRPTLPDGRPFWRPERVRRLQQLVTFDGLLPGWVRSRWVLAQAAQWLDESNRRRHDRSLLDTARILGIPDPSSDSGAAERLMDHDWVFRQLFLHEHGGLAHFVDDVAEPGLLAGADRVHEWVGVPMGAYQLLGAEPATIRWRDLRTEDRVTTANVGTAALLVPGDHALGRLVPTEDGSMFESGVLFVPGRAARTVAADPDRWTEAVAEAVRADLPHEEQCRTGGHAFAMVTDLPDVLRWIFVQDTAAVAAERPRTSDPEVRVGPEVEAAADLVVAAVVDRLECVLDDADAERRYRECESCEGSFPCSCDDAHWPLDPWPAVTAALLEPAVPSLVAARLDPADAPSVEQLGRMLPAPSAAVCGWLVDQLRVAA